jgi:hypothetical protein
VPELVLRQVVGAHEAAAANAAAELLLAGVGAPVWKILLLFFRSDPRLFPPISHCLIFPANLSSSYFIRHLIDSTPFISTDPLLSYINCCTARPQFFSINLDSKPFGSNKGYHSCSPLPSFPYLWRESSSERAKRRPHPSTWHL